MIKKICLPILFFAAFVSAGYIGLSCEQLHNDLTVSTGAFLTSFGTLSATLFRVWNIVT